MNLFEQFFPFQAGLGGQFQQHSTRLQAYQDAIMHQQSLTQTLGGALRDREVVKPGKMWLKWLRANRLSASISKQFKSQNTPTPERCFERLITVKPLSD